MSGEGVEAGDLPSAISAALEFLVQLDIKQQVRVFTLDFVESN